MPNEQPAPRDLAVEAAADAVPAWRQASSEALASRLDGMPFDVREKALRRLAEAATFIAAQTVHDFEEARWAAAREVRLAGGPKGESPETLAKSVVTLLCDDPNMWLTHGVPSEEKLALLERRVVEAIRFALGGRPMAHQTTA